MNLCFVRSNIFDLQKLECYLNKVNVMVRAVVRGVAGGAFVPPEFGVSEKRTERELDSLLLLAPTDLKT